MKVLIELPAVHVKYQNGQIYSVIQGVKDLKSYMCYASFENSVFQISIDTQYLCIDYVVPLPIVNVKTLVILSQLLCSHVFIPQLM
jgi:hypothetical protein